MLEVSKHIRRCCSARAQTCHYSFPPIFPSFPCFVCKPNGRCSGFTPGCAEVSHLMGSGDHIRRWDCFLLSFIIYSGNQTQGLRHAKQMLYLSYIAGTWKVGIEPTSAACRASALPAVLWLQPSVFLLKYQKV